jgi:hypothetical protein
VTVGVGVAGLGVNSTVIACSGAALFLFGGVDEGALVGVGERRLQLRVVARRHRRAHQPPGRDHSQQSGCRPGWLATR